MNNMETWAATNNLAFNCRKSKEIIFIDPRIKRQFVVPLYRCQESYATRPSNPLSVCHRQLVGVCGVINNSAQTLCALRVLRAHGMNDMAQQAIFRSVVVAKLLYASRTWCGCIRVADRQRVDAFLLRSKRCGYCPPARPAIFWRAVQAI